MLAKITKYISFAKSWGVSGASHHSAFKGSRPTIGHMLLALPDQWLSSPSKK